MSTFLVQNVQECGFIPLRVQLLLRFRKFFRSLLSSPSREVAIVALLESRDLRSAVGSNLRLIEEETGLNPWQCSPGQLKMTSLENSKVEIQKQDEWRVPYLTKLLEKRLSARYRGSTEEEEEIQSLINSLCIN